MPDLKIVRGAPVRIGLSDTKPVSGGIVVRDEFLVSADQLTIGGDGANVPLHILAGSPSADPTLVEVIAASALLPGMPVYPSGPGIVDKAKANAQATVVVIGLVTSAIPSSGSGRIKTTGPLALTQAEWNALTGDAGGLVFGDWYYVSATTAGHLVHDPNAPSGDGQFVIPIGQAISATTLNISIQKAQGL